MRTLVYLHGFLSAPESFKAQVTERWLPANQPDIDYRCPYLSPYPEETQRQLTQLMAEFDGAAQVGVVGSSLGGFWATWLVERYGVKAVLINPSVRPFTLIDRVSGERQHNYYTDDSYLMTDDHGEQFRAAYAPVLKDKSRYWLLAQTGDETLDYRQAVERYQGCRQSIEDGGDHSFQGYEKHLPNIIKFLFDAS